MLIPLGEPDGRTVWTVRASDEHVLAVFVVDGTYHVTDAVCPHNRGPLAQGGVCEDASVICPWHRYRFDLRSGRCHTTSRYRLAVYPVVERDGARYADLGRQTLRRSWSDILRGHARERR